MSPADDRGEGAPYVSLMPKPRLRGVSHLVAFVCTIAASMALVAYAKAGRATIVALVFGVSLMSMFGTSALYHRRDWSRRQHRRIKRFDHAAIFVAIAGGYTPVFALVPPSSSSGVQRALLATWLGASLGILKAFVWPSSPRWLTALAYVVFGGALLGELIDRVSAVEPLCLAMLVASGVLYSIGAIVYGRRRPNPIPEVFGYHEVFHALVVVGTACLFVHVVMLLRAIS